MKKNEAYGLFKDDEWQPQYGYGSRKAMELAQKIARENGDKGLTVKKSNFGRNGCERLTIFGKTIEEHSISCYRIHKDTGVCESTLHNWKKGLFRPTPYDENYKKVVEYIHEKTGVLLNLMDFVK